VRTSTFGSDHPWQERETRAEPAVQTTLCEFFHPVIAMPAKKSSKKAKAIASTTLVPHIAPNLASLLERAKLGLRSDV
jgi:hypothetical protein